MLSPAKEFLFKLEYGKNCNNNLTTCYVVGLASSGKAWCFFIYPCFFISFKGGICSSLSAVSLAPFSKVGNSKLRSTLFDYYSFYGI